VAVLENLLASSSCLRHRRLETIGYPERRVDPCIQAVSSRRFFSACVRLTGV
jgi:hypothetical protein